VIETIPDIIDSIVVDTGTLDTEGRLWLFVAVADGAVTKPLAERIRGELRDRLSPRHVPDEIRSIPEVPYTLSGKKLEVPIKRILNGTPPEEAVNRGTLRNPDALDGILAAIEAG
jgi:acetoacetyl-CoA synthetase